MAINKVWNSKEKQIAYQVLFNAWIPDKRIYIQRIWAQTKRNWKELNLTQCCLLHSIDIEYQFSKFHCKSLRLIIAFLRQPMQNNQREI